VQPCGQRRRNLARQHRVGEVPRGDTGHHTDRLFDADDAFVVRWLRNGVAVDALAFFGKPFDVVGAIGDFAARLGQRLALFQGHD